MQLFHPHPFVHWSVVILSPIHLSIHNGVVKLSQHYISATHSLLLLFLLRLLNAPQFNSPLQVADPVTQPVHRFPMDHCNSATSINPSIPLHSLAIAPYLLSTGQNYNCLHLLKENDHAESMDMGYGVGGGPVNHTLVPIRENRPRPFHYNSWNRSTREEQTNSKYVQTALDGIPMSQFPCKM